MNTIRIMLSEEAQKAAIIEGKNGAQLQSYDIGPDDKKSLERLFALPWTEVYPSGEVFCEVPYYFEFSQVELKDPIGTPIKDIYCGTKVGPFFCEKLPATTDEVLDFAESLLKKATDVLDEHRREYAKKQEEIAQREEKEDAHAQEWAILPVEERANVDGVLNCVPVDAPESYRGPLQHTGKPRFNISHLEKYCPHAVKEAREYAKKLQKERREHEEVWELQKHKNEHNLLLSLATAEEKERINADMLPESERLEILRRVFSSIKLPLRLHLTSAHILHDEYCTDDSESNLTCIKLKNEEVEYNSKQFKKWKELQKIVEEDSHMTATPCQTEVTCDDCGESQQTAWALVRYTYGNASVTRYFSLG